MKLASGTKAQFTAFVENKVLTSHGLLCDLHSGANKAVPARVACFSLLKYKCNYAVCQSMPFSGLQ